MDIDIGYIVFGVWGFLQLALVLACAYWYKYIKK